MIVKRFALPAREKALAILQKQLRHISLLVYIMFIRIVLHLEEEMGLTLHLHDMYQKRLYEFHSLREYDDTSLYRKPSLAVKRMGKILIIFFQGSSCSILAEKRTD